MCGGVRRLTRGAAWTVLAAALCLAPPARVGAQEAPAPTVNEVVVEREGRIVTDPAILELLDTTAGEPLSMRDVRETIAHLVSLNTFEDVRVLQEKTASGGVLIRYVLVPAHPIDRVDFEGTLGVDEDDLRRIAVDRLGPNPRAAQAAGATEALTRAYRDRGYPQATVTSRVLETHDPDRASLVFSVNAGARAVIDDLRITHADGGSGQPLIETPDLRRGTPYDRANVDRELQRWTDRLRARGYYEARASHGALFPPDGAALSVTLTQGPRIRVAFAGDPLSEDDRERLVPIEAEASADEDLLEDSSRAIEAFLKAEGHRDARVDFDRVPGDGEVVITFRIDRGPRYEIAGVRVRGNESMATAEIRELLRVKEGDVFAEAALGLGVASVRGTYRLRGFAAVGIVARQDVVAPERASDDERRIELVIEIAEGPRTLVRGVTFEGQSVVTEGALRGLAALAAGGPFSEVDVIAARDRIELEYRNRGYDQVSVQSSVTLAEADTAADIRFTLVEGQQAIVDRVLIVGAVRTNPTTIRRELLLVPGQPLGYSDAVESRARMAALGLFRRVAIEEVPHANETRRDVVVRVEESPPTTIGGGGGVEGAFRLRLDEAGQAEERFELVPRGFFEIGRRNLWGKNRAVNLFTRVSVRKRDVGLNEDGTPAEESTASGYSGFNEYRVVATFREPRVFGSRLETLVTGILEQAIRSSFNFARRELRAEAGLRLSPVYSLSGRYSFERTELFDERFTTEDDSQGLIDRLFPQVRLSTFSGSFIRDSRDDLVDASRGALVAFTSDVAMRAIGSEVGFVKAYLEAFSFRQLPTARRAVVAVGVRLGAANGFPREVPSLDEEGLIEVDDIPVSKRFFAGGDTTVRGFSLDRLGDAKTISPSGFPTGGNGVLVLNGEMRVGVVGPLQAVGFLDAGNVVARASELRLNDLRTAAGFGIRYRSPVGPIRLDLGFKLDRRELSPGRLERRSVWHISFGQAF
jgi:outer membrane protein insertion porin family